MLKGLKLADRSFLNAVAQVFSGVVGLQRGPFLIKNQGQGREYFYGVGLVNASAVSRNCSGRVFVQR